MADSDLQSKLNALSPQQREQLKRLLAAKREAARAAAAPDAPPPAARTIRPAPAAEDYPLSFAQKRLWLQEQLSEGKSAAYNVSLAVCLRGELRLDALERAFRAVIERHAVLRTRIVRRGDDVRQQVLDSFEWSLTRWAPAKGAEARNVFATRAEELANRPFALEAELPLRAAWMPLGENEHGLVMVFHHIACDGESVRRVTEDLQRFYAVGMREGAVSIDEPATRYVDFAVWHREWMESPAGVKAKAYWMNQFAEIPEPIELPADRRRPAVQDFTGRHLHLRLAAGTRERLAQVGQRSGASLFMTLLATVATFVHRYVGRNDITIGSPTAGRMHPQLDEVVGFFVNTVPLRVGLTPHETFQTVLARVRDSVLDAFEHQGCPFDVLVQSLPLERDLSRPPLFNIMLGLNRADDEAFKLPGLETEVVPLALASSKADLTFHFIETADGLDLDLEYATSLFDEPRMRRLLSYFETMVSAVTVGPEMAVGDLGLMRPDATLALIRSFNPPAAEYPRDRTLVELFREQVKRDPDADAVAFDGRRFSYAEIDRWSDALAGRLVKRLGTVRPEEAIALQVERSERMIVALLGILKTGGCYLPINPGTPTERVRTLLTAAGVRLRLTEGEAAVPGWKGVDADLCEWCGEAVAATNVTAPEYPGGPGRLAYIIFTSGSTGEPKGVLIEQQSVVRLVRGTDFLQLGSGDRVLQTGSLAFDASTFELWGPLLNGGCCCLPKGKEILEIEQFGDLLRSTGATTCFLTTGLFNQIADFHPEAFRGLRHLLTGGEKVSVPHVKRVRAAVPGLKFLHVYGPTENTTFSTWYPIASDTGDDVPIGRAIAHSTLYILDERGNLQPPGVAGEIFCGGDGLARGYLGRAELTAERFVPDPFSPYPGARLYRTGDFGCWNEAGQVEFIGRHDDQVKIRGFRIELGEIELRLRALPGIQQAVVVARPTGGTHELVAYLVGAAEQAEEALRVALGQTLPDYMVPAHFVRLDALPLNASGKVDRRALPAPQRVAVDPGEAANPAQWTDAGERELAAVWAEVLGRAPANREAHYFYSGGDSIKAIQITARLRTRGYRLQLRDVFARPRFGELATALVRTEGDMTDTVAAEGEIPLTPIQRWFLETFQPPFDHFNQATLLEADGKLDATLLRRAIETLVQRHAMLRCRLERTDTGDWRQQVPTGAGTLVWHEEEVSGLEAGPARAALETAARALHDGLSLEDGRLVAAGFFRGTGADRLLLVIHHWAIDGVSWRVLIDELDTIYRALAAGAALPERRPSMSFRGWSQALRRYAQSAELAQEARYWRDQIGPVAKEPARPAEIVEAAHAVVFSPELSTEIGTAAARAYGAQVEELLLAALSHAWEERGGGDSLLLALEGHGRESCVAQLDVSETVGWFTSLWPFRLESRGDWPERIRRVKDAMRKVPERGVGYGVLRYLRTGEAGAPAVPGCAPRVSFNYLGTFAEASGSLFRGIVDEPTGDPVAAHLGSPFDLDVVAEISGGRLRVSFHFHRATWDAAGRAALAENFERALNAAVRHCREATPQRSLSDFTGGLATLEEWERLKRRVGKTDAEIEDVLPLTPMQEGMVFHAQYQPDSAAYSDQVVLRLTGALDPILFEAAWQALGVQYPNLRTVFVTGETERPVGVIVAGSRLGYAWVDVTADASDKRIAVLHEDERRRGFDLATGPLLRLTLVKLAPEQHEVVLGFHHSLIDGWSSGLIWRRLETNYCALAEGKTLPQVAASFRDYARWLQKRDTEKDLVGWREVLAGSRGGASVPTGLPRLGAPPVKTRSFAWELGRARSEAIVAAARRIGTTESSLFQALWGVFLGRLNRTSDVVFGATISGRTDQVPHVESIVGLLINTIPVRVSWTADDSFEALATRLRAQTAAGLERLGVSLAEIQNVGPDSGELVRHTLVFENYPEDSEGGDGRPWQTETAEVFDPMHFEFGMIVVPRREGWLCRVVADPIRYPDAHLRSLQQAWEKVIDASLSQPEAPLESWHVPLPAARALPVVVAATFTAEPLEPALAFWLEALGGDVAVRFAPFNQVLQQLLDAGSALFLNREGTNLVLVRLEDWAGAALDDAAAVDEALEINGDHFVDGLRRLARAAAGARHFVFFCPASPAARKRAGLAERLASVEARLLRRIEAIGLKSICGVRSQEIMARFALAEVDQGTGEELGGVPYSEEFFAVLATEVVRRNDALTRPALKVLALDADNTLWRGVIGEDGVAGIKLTPAHRRLQETALAARQAGWVLVLVSKNNSDDLREAFREHGEFPLAWDDFVAVEAGWRPKSESMRAIAQQLNLGLDSFVFVDDSGMECAEVRAALPEVLVMQLPDGEENVDRFARHCWPIDAVAATAEDRQRSELYRLEARREETRQSSGGLREFIRQLQLETALVAIGEENLERAAQLTQRTNQFNVSTRRRTAEELREFLGRTGCHGRLLEVRDRFGNYGITGCVLYRDSGNVRDIDTLLLSCRVLGRGVEHRLLRQLAADAQARGIETLRIPFVRTVKNVPAEQFLKACAHRHQAGETEGVAEFVFEVARALELEVTEAESVEVRAPMTAPGATAQTAVLPAASHFYEFVAGRLSSTELLMQAVRESVRRQRHARSDAPYEEPSGEREQAVAKIWATVLGVERVGRRDSFFGLGGHSLKAVMMLSRVNRLLGTALPLESVFASPVLADFVARAAGAGRLSGAVEGISRAPAAKDYPLSAAQRRLWLIEQMRGPGPSPFHMPAVFALRGPLEPERLAEAFRRLIARHESLRTALVIVEGEARQVILPQVEFAIETLADENLAEFLGRDFDLARPPLLRVGLARRGEQAWTLAVVMHHLVSDGWSIGVMADELSAFYRDARAALPSLEIHYRDYTLWQASRLAGENGRRAADYWTTLLADLPPALELPADRLRPAIKQSRGAEVVEIAPAAAWEDVKQQARSEGLSPFMAVLAAVQAVLARQSGARRFVIGTPVAGRDLPELESQIGFYVNLLPLVAEVDRDRSVREHLTQVKAVVTGALSHASYPFDQLVNELKLPRDTSRTPLFDALLVFQSNRAAELSLGDVSVDAVELKTETSQYDLTFDVAETPAGLRVRLEYDRALFEEARMVRIARQVVAVLTRLLQEPALPLSRLEICPEEESESLRGFERGAAFGRYRARTLPELVAAVDPARTAVIAGDRVLTYGELVERAAQVARRIRGGGAERQELIVVAGSRSEAFVVALLGVMRAGCVYLPMDLKHPDERLRMVVEDGGVRHALAIGDEAEARLRGLGLNVIGNAETQRSFAEPGPTAEDLAYVIFTSGSTGRPKGVEISHGAFATMIEAQIAAFGVVPADRCAWWASCAFDASLSEIFLALASGAAVVVAEERQREDTGEFLEWLRRQRVTVATLPPAFLRVLRRVSLAPLRVLITAGEAADPGDVRHYARSLNVFNAYGPTETSVCATVQPVTAAAEGTPIPIGRPLAVAAAYVLDSALQRVPIGVPGELFVGGRIVGRGYRNAPALSAERFLPDPFAGETDARMYRTGDLVRWREDGALEFLGRDDGQIKIRGFRIELGEIEAVLRSLSGVRDVAVLGVPWAGGLALAAYVAAEPEVAGAVRAAVADRLPDYMRPTAYAFLERLPMTPNGKLDKAALPSLTQSDSDVATPPETVAERRLAAAWEDCLGSGAIGRESDFFALGGDSIKALDLSAKLRASGWSLGVRHIFAHPRLQDQAQMMIAAKSRESRAVEGVSELTPIQKWFLEAHAGSPLHHFNQAVFYEAAVRVDPDRLQRAVQAVWRRHAALRATFERRAEGWRQIFRAGSTVAPKIEWLELETDASVEHEAGAWVRSLQEGFNLENGPLVRYGVVRGRAADRVLCITHHLVSDWISHRILLEDLDRAYAAERTDEIALPPAVTELDEWVQAARRAAGENPRRSELAAAWARIARESFGLSVVTESGRYGEVAVKERKLSADETTRLRRRAAAGQGSGVRDAILAAIVRANREIFGRDALAIQLEGHGRDGLGEGIDVSRTVGWFTSLYPCVFRDQAEENENAAMRRVAKTLAQLPEPPDSYGRLRAYGEAGEIPAARTEIGFNYLGEFASGRAGGVFALAEELPGAAIAADFARDHPLDVTAWIVGDALHVQCAYLPGQRSAAEMDRWMDRVFAFLVRVADART